MRRRRGIPVLRMRDERRIRRSPQDQPGTRVQKNPAPDAYRHTRCRIPARAAYPELNCARRTALHRRAR